MDIECHHIDAVRSKALGNESAETTPGSSYYCNLLWPVISVFLGFPAEVVLGKFREEDVECVE